MSNSTSSYNYESIASPMLLSMLVPAVGIIAAGIIVRKKSDLSKLPLSILDCERLVRYILFPCVGLSYIAKSDANLLFGSQFLSSPLVIFSLIICAIIEPLFGVLMQKFANNNLLNKKKQTTTTTTNNTQESEKKEEEIETKTDSTQQENKDLAQSAILLGKLSLSSQSLAFPLGVALALELMYPANIEQDEMESNFGLNFDLLKMMIICVITGRAIAQRFGMGLVSSSSSSSNTTQPEDINGNKTQLSSFQQIHQYGSKINSFCGGHAAVVISILVGILFNKVGNTGSEESAGGVLSFFIGVAETLSDGFVPFACTLEGYQFIVLFWGGCDDNGEKKAIDETTEQNAKENEKEETSFDWISWIMSFSRVIVLQIVFRFVCAVLICVAFFQHDSCKHGTAVAAAVLSMLSCTTPYSFEYKLLFGEDVTEKKMVRMICLLGFVASFLLVPLCLILTDSVTCPNGYSN